MSVDTDLNISPVLGTGGDDVLQGTGRSEVLSGAQGDDTISALGGDDEVYGGTGNDTLMGQDGNDTMYGNGAPTFVDMSKLVVANTTTATVTFIDEGAGYRNALGVYEIGADGAISNVRVLFPNASKEGSGGSLVPGESAVSFDITAGTQLGFFEVSNGYSKGSLNREALTADDGHYEFRTTDGAPGTIHDEAVELWWVKDNGEDVHVRSQYKYAIFHSIGDASNNYAPNPDNYSHIVGRANSVAGQLLIGFEDLWGGGDNDYDDTVITIDIGQQNVVALLPPPSVSSGDKPDDDIMYGGDGADKMYGVSGDDFLSGGNGDDVICGNSGNDTVMGDDGADHLVGNSGDDAISGGNGDDDIEGNSGNDYLFGDAGNDHLQGGSGDDGLNGGSGNDLLEGGSGNDVIVGGEGDDTINGNSGDDHLDGEAGNDTLNGNSDNDILFGGAGADKVIGGSGNDLVDGGADNDKVYGGSGNDSVSGGAGDDYLSAGTGNDTVNGGLGTDKLCGGAGADIFVFDFALGTTGKDNIYDFSLLEDSLHFADTGHTSFDEIMTIASQVNSDTIFRFDGDTFVRVRNTDLDAWTDDLFSFA